MYDPVLDRAGIQRGNAALLPYGNMIEIAHGNGYSTRYAHNSRLLVSVGDTVEKGFQIAEIGSSGRSTGPHVHFEVLKNGVEVNPVKFIRASN